MLPPGLVLGGGAEADASRELWLAEQGGKSVMLDAKGECLVIPIEPPPMESVAERRPRLGTRCRQRRRPRAHFTAPRLFQRT